MEREKTVSFLADDAYFIFSSLSLLIFQQVKMTSQQPRAVVDYFSTLKQMLMSSFSPHISCRKERIWYIIYFCQGFRLLPLKLNIVLLFTYVYYKMSCHVDHALWLCQDIHVYEEHKHLSPPGSKRDLYVC